MAAFLWFLTTLLALIPLVMYLVYSLRRLDTRRELLLQNLLTLGLDDAYMRIRHGQSHAEWEQLKSGRTEKFIQEFAKDFKAETSHQDYSWPVTLVTMLSAIGWYFALCHVYAPTPGSTEIRGLVPQPFVWGFAGASLASFFKFTEEFRQYNLIPASYYAVAFRLLFASTAAYLVGNAAPGAVSQLVPFGIGLLPIEKTWALITDKTAAALGIGSSDREPGAELEVIQGLEDARNRRKLVEIDITSVQALATADPLFIWFQTTLPIRTVVDMVDKAILYLYVGEKVKDLRAHGINGVIELVALAKLINKLPAYGGLGGSKGFDKFFETVDAEQLIKDVAVVMGQTDDQLKAFIYNMYYDPVVRFIYDVWGRYLDVKPLDGRANETAAGPPVRV